MNGIESILSSVKSDSDKTVSKIIGEAQKKADAIIADAKKTADLNFEKEIATAKKNAETIMKRAESKVELEEKNIRLLKKQKLIKETVALAKSKIENYGKEEYFGFLKKLVEKNSNGKKGKIILSESDLKNANDDFKAFLKKNNLELSEKNIPDGEKGFVISYGDIEENCTLDALFECEYEALADIANEILFK